MMLCRILLLLGFWTVSLLAVPGVANAESALYRFHYSVTVPIIQKPFKLWIPAPPTTPHQRIIRYSVDSPFSWELKQEEQFGNKMIYLESGKNRKEAVIQLEFDLERFVDTGQTPEQIIPGGFNDPKKFVGATPWIPYSETITQIALEQTKGKKSIFEKIQALYDYIYNTMTYNKEGTGWGRGDPIWACANRRGNCTDFHSLFIALARTQQIPARFEIGVPIPKEKRAGKISGYHCWAQVFDNKRGWIPLDASESKKLRNKEAFFSRLPPDRILLSVGRGITLNPPQSGEAINYFFYPHLEIDGKMSETAKTDFQFQTLPKELVSAYPVLQP